MESLNGKSHERSHSLPGIFTEAQAKVRDKAKARACLLYTSDAADDSTEV